MGFDFDDLFEDYDKGEDGDIIEDKDGVSVINQL